MASIFISYRKGGKDDGSSHHLAEDLRKALGEDEVFRDEKGLAIGLFDQQLLGEAESCAAMIVVIGPDWIQRIEDLQDSEDWVRREIEVGLRRQILMVPFLIEGARLPEASELPDSLKTLRRYQDVRTSQRHWNDDVAKLIDALSQHLGLQRRDTPESIPNLSGIWVDTDGVTFELAHRGQDLQVSMLGPFGQVVGQGMGSVSGNQIQFSLQRPDYGMGTGTGTASSDGRQISGEIRYGMQRFGFSIWKR